MHHRNDVIRAIVGLLEAMPAVNAVWQGGAAAWKRIDEWSDIDLCVDTEDDKVEDVMNAVDKLLEQNFGIELRFDVLSSPWPGLRQRFFRLHNASPFMMIDFCIFKHSAKDKLLERHIHGEQIAHFDRKHVLDKLEINEEEWKLMLQKRLPLLQARFDMFQVLVEKELNRNNYIEAFIFYVSYTLNPLVELLRIKHAPYHYSFGSRYIHYDLPADVISVLQPLYFVATPEELRNKWVNATMLFKNSLAQGS